MNEYDLDFAEAMSKASGLILQSKPVIEHAERVSLYITLVACELSLKHLIEKARVTVPHTHDMGKLLDLVSECTVEVEGIGVNGEAMRVPAVRIRGESVPTNDYNDVELLALGRLLDPANEQDEDGNPTSRFPNEIRYGSKVVHFDASVMQRASMVLVEWARQYAPSIRGP